MPDGVLAWFDDGSGEGRIHHGGRRYTVRSGDIEPKARVAGARVHFDVRREDGARMAVNVRLRSGTRVSRRQRRFGDLVGARSADSKGTTPFVHDQSDLARDLARHPHRVARTWAELLAAGDLDEAMLLYAPHAVVHSAGELWIGPAVIRRELAASSLFGGPSPSAIVGDDGTVVVSWPPARGDGPTHTCRSRIRHGEIVEQWLGEVHEVAPSEAELPAIELSTAGEVGEADTAYAVEKMTKVLQSFGQRVLHASIRLERAADPARERPCLARAAIDVNGEPLRAHVAAATMLEAVDLLEARLRHRLEHLREHRKARRRHGPGSQPGEWRHGDLPTWRPPYFPRPAAERAVVRHKTYAAAPATIDEAVFELESLDLDFHLFPELGSGRDAVVSRGEAGMYSVRFLGGPVAGEELDALAAVELDDRPIPVLTVAEAQEHLDNGDEPWVFYADSQGRGHVLYRRYDGHYGLIDPAESSIEDSDVLALFRRAVPVTSDLVHGVEPDRWTDPTPCVEMTVGTLVEHVVGGLQQFAAVAGGSPLDPTALPSLEPEYAPAAFDRAAERMVVAWSAPGALDRTYPMPWGDELGSTLVSFMLMEEVTHGWDLARSTGQDLLFDDELVAAVLELAQTYDDESIRVPGMFGPAVPVDSDAPVVDRLAAFLGRDPARWPGKLR